MVHPLLQCLGQFLRLHEVVHAVDTLAVPCFCYIYVGEQGGYIGYDITIGARTQQLDGHGVEQLYVAPVVGRDITITYGGDGGNAPVESIEVGIGERGPSLGHAHLYPAAGYPVHRQHEVVEKEPQPDNPRIDVDTVLHSGLKLATRSTLTTLNRVNTTGMVKPLPPNISSSSNGIAGSRSTTNHPRGIARWWPSVPRPACRGP